MTEYYCSPEQANGEKLSRKTDIWSWAVSVLEMFIRVHPRHGAAAPDLLEMHLQDKAGAGLPPMPQPVVELLRHCFRRDPVARPQDFRVVACRLREVYQVAVGQEHRRVEPVAAELLADQLNNRAISLLDLGKQDKAEQAWQLALQDDIHHLLST